MCHDFIIEFQNISSGNGCKCNVRCLGSMYRTLVIIRKIDSIICIDYGSVKDIPQISKATHTRELLTFMEQCCYKCTYKCSRQHVKFYQADWQKTHQPTSPKALLFLCLFYHSYNSSYYSELSQLIYSLCSLLGVPLHAFHTNFNLWLEVRARISLI